MKCGIVLFALLLSFPPVFGAAATIPSSANLDKTAVPASGSQEVLLTVSRFGRYAVVASSAQGVALQLIDRITGPGPIAGSAGERDGRLDLFLDPGEYKLVSYAHPEGEGAAKLRVRGFEEQHGPQSSRLVEHKLAETDLQDLQVRSYWLEIDARRWVAIEAAGRGLADLRLWKDGNWLIDARPEQAVAEPRPGKPLNVRRLAAELEPGRYLLSAYGGPAQPWAEAEELHPLYLRFGIPDLAEAGRARHWASPFGVDRWRVPGKADYFRLELPAAAPASLRVTEYREQNPFVETGILTTIDKDSRLPVAEIETEAQEDGFYLLSVEREAGRPYLLQHFPHTETYTFEGEGLYWLGILSAGYAADAVPVTAVLTGKPKSAEDEGQERLVAASAIEINARQGWRGRFNLSEPVSLFLEVTETGTYAVGGEGAEALYRVEPFLLSKPEHYQAPPARPGGHGWTLNPGFYVLGIEPLSKGILDLHIGAPSAVMEDASTIARFPRLRLHADRLYTLHLNQRPQVKTGVLLRALPLDLSRGLPLTLAAGKTLDIPVWAPERGELIALGAEDEPLALGVDESGVWKDRQRLTPGRHLVRLRNPSDRLVQVFLDFRPTRLAAETPLPPPVHETAPPEFPLLAVDAPRYLQLDRREQRTFRVAVDQPGLYRLETTGLLATAGNLRTRTRTSISQERANGIGRNFLIQEYLGEGEYQLSLSPQGKSRGPLGLRLARTRLHDGGRLAIDLPARHSLPAGHGLRYEFQVMNAGRYRLRVLGLERRFRLRLEDAEGWPVTTPGQRADIEHYFDAGTYRLIVLPEAVDGRVVTVWESVPEPREFEGHGPHLIHLGETVTHTWREPAAGEERLADVWTFAVPAPIDAVIRLGNEMYGPLFSETGGEEPVAVVPPAGVWKGRLETGRYRLEARNVRRNDYVDYEIEVRPEQLVPGQSRHVEVPTEVPVSVGREGLVLLNSLGTHDVQARLYDEEDNLLVRNDDRDDDWNFLIEKPLRPGFYRLKLDPVGRETAATSVAMAQPEEVIGAALTAPTRTTVTGSQVHRFPIEAPQSGKVLSIAAHSAASVGMMLEQRKDGEKGWRALRSVAGSELRLGWVPDSQAEYRLRVWSRDGGDAEIRLSLDALMPLSVDERKLAGEGVMIAPEGGTPAALVVRLQRPGVFRLKVPENAVEWALSPGQAFAPGRSEAVAIPGETWWLLAETETRLRAERVRLSAGGEAVDLSLPPDRPATLDLEPGNGLVLVLAEAHHGQAGLAVGEDEKGIAGMGVAEDSSVAVGLDPGISAVRLWNAGNAAEPWTVRVRQRRYERPEAEAVSWGLHDFFIENARSLRLPEAWKRLRLTLPARTAAVLVRDREVLQTLWSGSRASTATFDAAAGELLLLAMDAGSQPASLELTPLLNEREALRLAAGGPPLRRHFGTRGTLYLPYAVADGESAVLRVLGAGAEAAVLQTDGSVERGHRLTVRRGGTLTIHHGVGLLVAWLERGTGPSSSGEEPIVVNPPATIPLNGRSVSLSIHRDEPAFLKLRTASPVLLQIRTPAGAGKIQLLPHGADRGAYLPPGATTLTLLPASGDRLAGTLDLFTEAATPLDEGLGPEVHLAPGDGRLFAFTVERQGAVGVGVRASADVVDTRLYAENGRLLGEGVVQMHELSPGVYMLMLQAPPDGPPVRARPTVVGIERPGSGPPAEVVRRYLEQAGLEPVP